MGKNNQYQTSVLVKNGRTEENGIIITYPTGFAVVKTGMRSPGDSLVVGEDTRSLSFKEENTLAQGLAVVMAGQSQRKTKKNK